MKPTVCDDSHLIAAAAQSTTSSAVLLKICLSDCVEAKRVAARRNDLTPQMFTVLADDVDDEVRINLSSNENITREAVNVFLQYVNDRNSDPETSYVKQRIVSNLAANKQLFHEAATKIAGSRNVLVLTHLVRNPSIEPSIILRLLGSNYVNIRRRAKQHPKFEQWMSDYQDLAS